MIQPISKERWEGISDADGNGDDAEDEEGKEEEMSSNGNWLQTELWKTPTHNNW